MFRRWSWLTGLCLLMAVSVVFAQEQCAAIQTLITTGPPEECDRLAVGWLCIITPGTVVNGYGGAITYNEENQDLGYSLPLYETTWVQGEAATPDSSAWGMIYAKLPLVESEPQSIYRPPFANLIISGDFTLDNIVMVQPELLTSVRLETGTSDPACAESLLDGVLVTVPSDSELDLSFAINDIDLIVPPNGALFLTVPSDAAATVRSLSEEVTVNGIALPAGMVTTVLGGEVASPTEATDAFAFVPLEALQPIRAIQALGFAEIEITVTPDTFGVGPVFDLIEADAVTLMSVANNQTGEVFAVTRAEASDWVLADTATVEIDLSDAQAALDQVLETLLGLQHRSTLNTPFPDIYGVEPSHYTVTLQTAQDQRILHVGDLTPGTEDARYVAFDEDLMSVLVVAAVETFDDVIFPLVDDPQTVLVSE